MPRRMMLWWQNSVVCYLWWHKVALCHQRANRAGGVIECSSFSFPTAWFQIATCVPPAKCEVLVAGDQCNSPYTMQASLQHWIERELVAKPQHAVICTDGR